MRRKVLDRNADVLVGINTSQRWTLPQLRETQCVKMRGQFVLLPEPQFL